MDVTRRLREPAAWLLLAAVLIAAVSGIVEMLSGLSSSDNFPIEASNASYQVLAAAPVAMSFFAVLLAIKFGPVLERARVIVIGALGVQCLAALVGLVAWISTLFGGLFSSASDGPLAATTNIPGLLLRFVEGGVYLALLGLAIFYSVTTLKLPELAPKPKPQPAPQQGYGPYPGAPGGYPGMQPGPQMGQPGQTGQHQPYGQPPGQPGPQPGYPSGQQAPMSGYQPQEYGQPDSTYQMPSVGEPSGPQQPGPGFAGGPQPGYPAPSEPSGPQFAPPPGPGGQGGQPGWPGGYGQQSGPQQPQSPPPGQGWPSGFGQEAPQTPDPYGQGGFGQPGPSGPGAFGQQPEAPSPYQEPPQYDAPGFGEEPSPFGGTSQPEAEEPQRPGAEQQNGGGFDALFGGRPDADEPDDVQRTSRIEHDPEAFRRYQPPPGDQQ